MIWEHRPAEDDSVDAEHALLDADGNEVGIAIQDTRDCAMRYWLNEYFSSPLSMKSHGFFRSLVKAKEAGLALYEAREVSL
jgi:hypothetical protein